MSERGQWFTRPDGLRVLVTLHPAALLRTPPEFQATSYLAWLADLRQADSLVQTAVSLTPSPAGERDGARAPLQL